ncbi:ankyrin repeat domain-containing protein 12-like [Mya arenaria]|uniref:ankyrin repeat domain-containing protein 12-like n=1 Tax=Mya arenaria TaxID=6604 RepID=UPI0022E61544|nr:ankyrin repeat domain-containing protein 12-like [Mya arenaria]
MDGKKARRRKSKASNGRSEEKPKMAKVTNEKEEHDRLEAASVLSSLIYLPPKEPSSKDDTPTNVKSPQTVTTETLTYFPNAQSRTGIPESPHHLRTQTKQARGRGTMRVKNTASARANDQNAALLANMVSDRVLENIAQLKKSKNSQQIENTPTANEQAAVMAAWQQLQRDQRPIESHVITPERGRSNSSLSRPPTAKVPRTINTDVTVNKTVAMALRQAVASNINKVETDSSTKNKTPTSTVARTDKVDIEGASKKKDDTETKLPLKKRRLIGVDDENSSLLSSEFLTRAADSVTTSRNLESMMQLAKQTSQDLPSLVTMAVEPSNLKAEGYRPVKFDPRTSLLVLQDVRVALTPDEDGDLPLHIAVVHENLELVKKFIDIMAMSGKTVDRFNKLQQTPLHLAVLVNQPEIVKELLVAGANPNLFDRNGCTSVHLSVCKRFHACLRTVFDHSMNAPVVNSRDYEGYSPMHTAVEQDNMESLQILIEKGADIDNQDGKAGRSVLFYATEYNRTEMVRYLLEVGANAELQNYTGIPPLVVSQTTSDSEEICTMLRRAMDVAIYGDTPLPDSKKSLPRISSKSSMDSLDQPQQEEKYVNYTRQYSNSSNSPIDLSIHKTQSWTEEKPQIGPKQRKKREKKDHKSHSGKGHGQGKGRISKEKHANIIAALERKHSTSLAKSVDMNHRESVGKGLPSPDSGRNSREGSYDNNDNSESAVKSSLKTDNDKIIVKEEVNEFETEMDTNETESADLVRTDSRRKDKSKVTRMETETGSPSKDVNHSYRPHGALQRSFSSNKGIFSLESQPLLASQQLLASQPLLASRFSDLLNNLAGPLKSEDVFQILKPFMNFNPQQAGLVLMDEKNLADVKGTSTDESSVKEQNSDKKVLNSIEALNNTNNGNAKESDFVHDIPSKCENRVSKVIENETIPLSENQSKEVVETEESVDEKSEDDKSNKRTTIQTPASDSKPDKMHEDETNSKLESGTFNENDNSDYDDDVGLESNLIIDEGDTEQYKYTLDGNGGDGISNDSASSKEEIKHDKTDNHKFITHSAEIDNTTVEDNNDKTNVDGHLTEETDSNTSTQSPLFENNVIQDAETIGKLDRDLSNKLRVENSITKVSDSPFSDLQGKTISDINIGGQTVPVSIVTTVPTSELVGEVLKQGKSTTLYYRDGDGYKPIRIFMDDSQQSSLVLKKMLQSNMLQEGQNRDARAIPVIHSSSLGLAGKDISNVTINSSCASSIDVHSSSAAISIVGIAQTNGNIAGLGKPVSLKSLPLNPVSVFNKPIFATSTACISPAQSSFINQNALHSNTPVPVASTVITNNSNHIPNAQITKAHITLAPKPSLPSATVQNDIASIINVDVLKKQKASLICGYPKKLEKTDLSERTLTFVNPDVKSKLSKALQSPQRKLVPVTNQSVEDEKEANDTEYNTVTTAGSPDSVQTNADMLTIDKTEISVENRQPL